MDDSLGDANFLDEVVSATHADSGNAGQPSNCADSRDVAVISR
jgi:hypothetical protein